MTKSVLSEDVFLLVACAALVGMLQMGCDDDSGATQASGLQTDIGPQAGVGSESGGSGGGSPLAGSSGISNASGGVTGTVDASRADGASESGGAGAIGGTGGIGGISGTGGVGGASGAGGSGGAIVDGSIDTAVDASDAAIPDDGGQQCPASDLNAGDHEGTINHAGVEYGYILHIPPSYDGTRAMPLLLNWHGLTSNAAQQADFSGMNAQADASGYIVLYPDSPTNSWDAGSCCLFGATRDDVGFARALVAQIQSQVCVDEKRIYSTGMSNGGFMSHRLACEAADLFAAVAPVAGVNGMPTCSPSRPISVMHFHGTQDTLVSYTSVPSTIDQWVSRNGCAAGAPTESYNNGTVRCETYDQCQDGVEVVLCTVQGGGHCWPGNPTCPYGYSTTDINANDAMLEFFSKQFPNRWSSSPSST